MLAKLYARAMYAWETALTTRDSNRVVRPVEWGFDWVDDFIQAQGWQSRIYGQDKQAPVDGVAADAAMRRLNAEIIRHSDDFFGYRAPSDFRLETRHPQLFPTNVRPETLAQDAEMKRRRRPAS